MQPNTMVHSRDNVTLLCNTPYKVDTFILSMEGAAQQPQWHKSKFQVWKFQAEFSMITLTSDILGTYRFYASEDSSLYLLSYDNASVELTLSGEVIQIFLSWKGISAFFIYNNYCRGLGYKCSRLGGSLKDIHPYDGGVQHRYFWECSLQSLLWNSEVSGSLKEHLERPQTDIGY